MTERAGLCDRVRVETVTDGYMTATKSGYKEYRVLLPEGGIGVKLVKIIHLDYCLSDSDGLYADELRSIANLLDMINKKEQ